MHGQPTLIPVMMAIAVVLATALPGAAQHSFTLGQEEFLLDGKPFQIISGEVIPLAPPKGIGNTAYKWPRQWDERAFAQAALRNPNVPAFSSETHPAGLTHWGEPWAQRGTQGLLREVTFLLENSKSFNFHVIHGARVSVSRPGRTLVAKAMSRM